MTNKVLIIIIISIHTIIKIKIQLVINIFNQTLTFIDQNTTTKNHNSSQNLNFDSEANSQAAKKKLNDEIQKKKFNQIIKLNQQLARIWIDQHQKKKRWSGSNKIDEIYIYWWWHYSFHFIYGPNHFQKKTQWQKKRTMQHSVL